MDTEANAACRAEAGGRGDDRTARWNAVPAIIATGDAPSVAIAARNRPCGRWTLPPSCSSSLHRLRHIATVIIITRRRRRRRHRRIVHAPLALIVRVIVQRWSRAVDYAGKRAGGGGRRAFSRDRRLEVNKEERGEAVASERAIEHDVLRRRPALCSRLFIAAGSSAAIGGERGGRQGERRSRCWSAPESARGAASVEPPPAPPPSLPPFAPACYSANTPRPSRRALVLATPAVYCLHWLLRARTAAAGGRAGARGIDRCGDGGSTPSWKVAVHHHSGPGRD